jgi:hypothetical protein
MKILPFEVSLILTSLSINNCSVRTHAVEKGWGCDGVVRANYLTTIFPHRSFQLIAVSIYWLGIMVTASKSALASRDETANHPRQEQTSFLTAQIQ